VFLCGMEEGLFPHQRSIDEPGGLEEERRLCYVGMTRAMSRLTLCYAEVRRLYGRERYTRPSRFVGEIPGPCVEEIGPARIGARLIGQAPAAAGFGALAPGRSVRHKKFGDGLVIALEGQGEHARVQVNFAKAGTKWLVCAYAGLEAL